MANDERASGSPDDLTEAWRQWAVTAMVTPNRVDDAVAAALAMGRDGAGVAACAAAALVAAGLGGPAEMSRLNSEADFAGRIAAEIDRVAPALRVAATPRRVLVTHFNHRMASLRAAALRKPTPAAAAIASTPAAPATIAAPAAPARPPRPPLGPSLRQFISENSILLLSYTGAFLLFVATVLFELYGVAGTNRFGAVLTLDLVFAAAGWACLRSTRLRLVGHTYVAIFALLTPLVFAAAYVFLRLGRQGISIDLALLVTGAGCAALYAGLAARLRSEAYGLLALLAMPVACYGATGAAGLGPWRGPVLATLVAAYSFFAYPPRRLPAGVRTFSRFAPWFVPAAALGALSITAFDASSFVHFPSGLFAVTFAVIGAGYVFYAAAGVERRPEGAVAAAAAALLGAVGLLISSNAAAIWYPVALGVLSVLVYAAQIPWERLHERGSAWVLTHRYLGLAGSAMTALAGFVLQDQARPGTIGCALAGLAVLIFAGLTWVDARRHGNQRLGYGATFAASLASYFAVRYSAITEPQWYVAAPGLTLIAIGLRIPHDARLAVDQSVTQVLTALGVALLFGTTALEALTDQGWAHTAFLVAEGAAALVAGIGFRSRVLVVAGGAAIGVAALRALFVLIQSHLLFVAFGAVALVLLALGAAMALLRDQVQEVRTGFSDSWRDWN